MTIINEGYEDIFASPVKWIVIPVNTYGVAGAGLALEMKKRSPSWFYYYKRGCRKKGFDLNSVGVGLPGDIPYGVITVPTKNHWRENSTTKQIERVLAKIVEIDQRKPFHSLSIPPIGCGRGELDYKNQVRNLIYQYLHPTNMEVRVCFFSTQRQ